MGKRYGPPATPVGEMYRNETWHGLWTLGRSVGSAYSNVEFERWLEAEYDHQKSLLANLHQGITTDKEFNSYLSLCVSREQALNNLLYVQQLTVYAMAVARLTYGRLEAVDDILDYYPFYGRPLSRENRAWHWLIRAVNQIAQIPFGVYAFNNDQEFRARAKEWLRANEQNLSWNSEKLCFEWSNWSQPQYSSQWKAPPLASDLFFKPFESSHD